MTDVQVLGPGDDGALLVLRMEVSLGAVMKIEDGESGRVMHLNFISRSLASVKELSRHGFVLDEEQSQWLVGEIMRVWTADDE